MLDDFTLPHKPHDYQWDALKESKGRSCVLLQHGVGLGKSLISLMIALQASIDEGVEQILVLCPPILIDQAEELFLSVPEVPGVAVFRGTPGVRAQINIEGTPIVIMSYNIFRGKKDSLRVRKLFGNRKLCVIADELSCKSLKSKTYRLLKKFMYGKLRVTAEDKPAHKLIALNATPISDPSHVYSWCALLAPGLYPSKRVFDARHIKRADHWGNVVEWRDLDALNDAMAFVSINTDQYVELPELVTTEIPYSLEAKHRKLYQEVLAAELDRLPEDKIQLAVDSMFSTLQRLALMPSEFGLDIKPPILDWLESYLGQLGDQGVVIFTRHKAVSKMIHEFIPDSEAFYGESKGNMERVKSGACTRVVANIDSAGHGLNWQMLNHIVYAELPFRHDKFIQTIGRVHRQGQTNTCFVNIPIAKGTIQRQIYTNLLKNRDILNKVIKTKEDVRKFLTSA